MFHVDTILCNIGTKCNSLTQQFIRISTTIDTWATCFPNDPQCLHNSVSITQEYKSVSIGDPTVHLTTL